MNYMNYPYMKIKDLYQYGKPVYELNVIDNRLYTHTGNFICNLTNIKDINQILYNNGYAPLYNILGFEYQWLAETWYNSYFYHHFSLKDNKFHNHHNTIGYKLNDYIELYKILYTENNIELNYYLKNILMNYEMFGNEWFNHNELNLHSWEKYDKIETRKEYKKTKKHSWINNSGNVDCDGWRKYENLNKKEIKSERFVRKYNLSSTGKYKTMRYYRNDKKYKALEKEFNHDVNQLQ